MQAVGRIGSYISKSVYTVSGTFHPFGGAVDIIVVEQPDGSYKSSPWYVRFGKFQGVLKSKEKVVGIRVNDEEAGFHMHLDSKGEAFFMQEVDGEEGECEVSPPSSSGEDMEGQLRWPLKSKSCNCDSSLFEPIVSEKKVLAKTNNRQFFGFFGRKPPKDEGVHGKENARGVKREGSLEAAEMAADLLELRWSTNLGSSRRKKDNPKALSAADTSKKEVTSRAEANGVEVKCRASEYIVSPSVESIRETTALSNPEPSNIAFGESDMHVSSVSLVSEVANSDSDTQDTIEKLNGLSDAKDNTRSFCSSEVSGGSPLGLEESSEERKNSFCHEECQEVCIHADDHVTIVHEEKISVNGGTSPAASESTVTECYSQLVMDIDGKSESGSLYLSRVAGGGVECSDPKCCSSSSLDQSDINDYTNGVDFDTQRYRSSDVRIEEIDSVHLKEPIRTRSLPSMVDLCDSLEAMDPNYFSNELPSRIPAGLPAKPGYPPRSMDTLGREKNGPFLFKRSTCIKVSDDEHVDGVENPDSSSDLEKERDVTKVKANKKKVRTLTPTSKQLESLKLKPGKNTVIFTFSTAMLGNQQVDARVFLWRWDDKIVISDVDGTITRSDLLGQVMPLVGMDWSQTGVAHLFSAIKENGYQLLFLSARSISQSYITRQFLLNIKQDGKALPEGPVVISPDGLFPSLFREVVRRAPHEFKIACLEDIKALFPADRNPFYAGFGNRDTDEVSYLKVGIPLGKIFIINPKGEIAVNRRVDTKSYVSLHTLVHGMFPNTFSSEQEDFNSWNFWKLPPPSIDL